MNEDMIMTYGCACGCGCGCDTGPWAQASTGNDLRDLNSMKDFYNW